MKKCRIEVVYLNDVDLESFDWLHLLWQDQLSQVCILTG